MVRQFYIIYPKSLIQPVNSIIMSKQKLKSLKTLKLGTFNKSIKKIKKPKKCKLSQNSSP